MLRLPQILLALALVVQSTPGQAVRRVADDPRVQQALADLDRTHDRLVSDIIALTEIPAPPFKEDRRAAAYLSLLRQTGLTNVERDAEGNVMGLRKGKGTGPLIAFAAHLDTVFPDNTDVHVKRAGTRLSAPGVGDNSRSLAVLLAIVRAMREAAIDTTSDILFVANVGEEGTGDLRGMRYLFTKGPYKDRIKTFISMDGAGSGNHIITRAVGSRRYRVTFTGPGGHSYGAFGLVNPSFALGAAIDKFSRIAVPASPRTTFNVGLIGGGTSVNAIPAEAWMEIDMRSESPDELAALERQFKTAMQEAVNEENSARSTAVGKVAVSLKLIGDRPAGETPANSSIVTTAGA